MKSYTVRDSSGKSFEVDEDKIGEAEKDGFLPVVSNGKDEHRVSFVDMEVAAKDGFKPLQVAEEKSFLSKTGDFIDAASENMTDMLPGKGIITKAATLVPAGVEYAYDRIADKGTPRSFADTYDENLKENLEYQDKRRNASDAGAVVGTGMGLVTGLKIPGLGKSAPTRILGNAAMSAVDSGTRGEDLVDLESAGEGALTSGGISAALESLPYVGKGVKAASRLIPGTENALPIINKGVSKLASFIPGTDIEADQLNDLLSNPGARKAARDLKKPEALDKIGEGTADLLNEIDTLTNNQVSKAYGKGQSELMEQVGAKDVAKFDFTPIQQIKDVVDQKPEFYGRASKVINQVEDILQTGGPKDIGKAHQDMPLAFMEKNFGGDNAAKIQTQRFLNARRHIDDVTKNADWDKMLHSEKEAIISTRDAINYQLEQLTGSKSLRDADKAFAEYTPAKKNAFEKLSVPLPSGGREINADSALAFLKSDKAQSRFIENKLNDLGNVMEKFNIEGSSAVKDLNEVVIKSVKDNFTTLRALENLKKASGGPTSQAINTALQIAGAGVSGGYSLLALPITNPSAWMKLVDEADPLLKPLFDKITAAARRMTKDNPQFATRLYMAGKQYQENGEEEK